MKDLLQPPNNLKKHTPELLKPSYSEFPCEVSFGREIYKAKINTWDWKEIPKQIKTESFMRIIDEDGHIIPTINEELKLNSNIGYLANRIGSPYSNTEWLVFYPNSYSQAISFPQSLKKSKFLGEVSEPNLSTPNQFYVRNTLSDGFFYEFEGTAWKVLPQLFKKGIPYRNDMQFYIKRKPDYRVPVNYVTSYLSSTHKERAVHLIESLQNLSEGTLIIRI